MISRGNPQETIKDFILEELKHKEKVSEAILLVSNEINKRTIKHDTSKITDDLERDYYSTFKDLLERTPYGSEEYKALLIQMQPALDSHYRNNPHHPEHFKEQGVTGMTLVDLVEMACDWAIEMMYDDEYKIKENLLQNQTRYGLSDDITKILENTIKLIHKNVQPDNMYWD